MASVTLKSVNKFYDDKVQAVKDADLTIQDREFVVLVGPSGCGKSTLLRMIAGLEDISSGKILIADKVVNEVAPKDRDIAMVFQNYALYPHMNVFDNMAFGLKIRKYDAAEIKNRVEEAADLLGLTEYLNRKPKALSGGQRQRVAVGRAIVRKPKVFLFDEPLSNLDAKLRVQMRIEISKLHRKLGTTMIYVTHDQVEAMTMGDRIVVMKDGVVQQVDSPLNLYNQPSNQFVAGFIGSPAMNFIPGTIEHNENIHFYADDNFKLQLNNDVESLKEGKVKLGIRPEHLEISETPALFKATVEVIETMGSEIYLYLKSGKLNLVLRQSSIDNIKPGDEVQLHFNQEHIRIFDAESGLTLNKEN